MWFGIFKWKKENDLAHDDAQLMIYSEVQKNANQLRMTGIRTIIIKTYTTKHTNRNLKFRSNFDATHTVYGSWFIRFDFFFSVLFFHLNETQFNCTIMKWNHFFFYFEVSKEHMTFRLLTFFSQELNCGFSIWIISKLEASSKDKKKQQTFMNTFADTFIANVFNFPLKK